MLVRIPIPWVSDQKSEWLQDVGSGIVAIFTLAWLQSGRSEGRQAVKGAEPCEADGELL
jgi:hypothetical protein